MNSITVVGNLCADPTMETIGSQLACKFRVAAQNKHKTPEGTYESNFYSCILWGKRGETIAKYFKKGNKICIRGDLTLRSYVDNTGVNRTSADINVDDFDFVESAASRTATAQAAPAPAAPAAPAAPQFTAVETDDLPF